jgi:uncharacterized membrane protein YuzA (DUF378 family)
LTIQHLDNFLTNRTAVLIVRPDSFYTGGLQLDLLAATLLIIGGLNWGLVAIAKFDLVAWLFGLEFGQTNTASRIVYALVGLAAIYGIGVLVSRARTVSPAPVAAR